MSISMTAASRMADLGPGASGQVELIRIDTVPEEVESFSQTDIRGSGGDGAISAAAGGSISSISITSSTTHFHRIWVTAPDGAEHTLTFDSDRLPIRPGQTCTTVYLKGPDATLAAVFRNQGSGKETDLIRAAGLARRLGAGLSPTSATRRAGSAVLAVLAGAGVFAAVGAATALGLAAVIANDGLQFEGFAARLGLLSGLAVPAVLLGYLTYRAIRRASLTRDGSSGALLAQARDLAR